LTSYVVTVTSVVTEPGQLQRAYGKPFLARDSMYAVARCMLSPILRPSVCLSVTRVDQSKTVEVRIMQPSPRHRVAP